jgi:branched-chain amino acid transport system substrate-binding protein
MVRFDSISQHIFPVAFRSMFWATCWCTGLYGAHYDVGASDTEIRIGNISPITGPINYASQISATAMAYMNKINDEGGINNRKIVFIRKDDAFDPSKTVTLTRELVETDRVLLLCITLGTSGNLAVKDYIDRKQIPQLFIISGLDAFYDPVKAPWILPGIPKYSLEGKILANYLIRNRPDASVAAIYLNTDGNKSAYNGFRNGLDKKADAMIVKALSVNVTDPSVESQMKILKNSGANTLFCSMLGKLAVQCLQLAYDMEWRPFTMIYNGSITEDEIQQIGPQKLIGTVMAEIYKDPSNPRWQDDKGINDYKQFMQKYHPTGNLNSKFCVQGYLLGQLLASILHKAGDNLTRENIMSIATNMNYTSADFPVLLPGIDVHTTPDNYEMFSQMKLVQYNGKFWAPMDE